MFSESDYKGSETVKYLYYFLFVMQAFAGNSNRNTVVKNNVDIVARYIKIHVVDWRSHISMRLELYGCAKGL